MPFKNRFSLVKLGTKNNLEVETPRMTPAPHKLINLLPPTPTPSNGAALATGTANGATTSGVVVIVVMSPAGAVTHPDNRSIAAGFITKRGDEEEEGVPLTPETKELFDFLPPSTLKKGWEYYVDQLQPLVLLTE